MERIEKTIDVDAPLRAVYNQWTQFEEFPRFMEGVKAVRQIDDTHVHWHAEIWGKDKEWDAEITEQEPDKRVSWKSVSGPESAGTVRFEPLEPNRTEVRLAMAYETETEGAIEKAGDAIGVINRRVQKSLEQFKKFIEQRGRETGGWRGMVHDSHAQSGQYQNRARTTDEERRQKIATAAYYKAEKRGFEAGRDVEDWLEAEQSIDDSL